MRLKDAGKLCESGVAPANWKFDPNEFWIEEHGLIMEKVKKRDRKKERRKERKMGVLN